MPIQNGPLNHGAPRIALNFSPLDSNQRVGQALTSSESASPNDRVVILDDMRDVCEQLRITNIGASDDQVNTSPVGIGATPGLGLCGGATVEEFDDSDSEDEGDDQAKLNGQTREEAIHSIEKPLKTARAVVSRSLENNVVNAPKNGLSDKRRAERDETFKIVGVSSAAVGAALGIWMGVELEDPTAGFVLTAGLGAGLGALGAGVAELDAFDEWTRTAPTYTPGHVTAEATVDAEGNIVDSNTNVIPTQHTGYRGPRR